MTRGRALSAVVLLHLVLNLAHGRAHAGAQVPLPLLAALFVYAVILAGPLIGLAAWRWRPRLGGWMVAASMGGALVFGLINHFIIEGPDHIGHVAAAWRQLFSITAVLLVICEAAGAGIGIWSASPGPTEAVAIAGVEGRSSRSDLKVGPQGRSSRSELKVGAQGRTLRSDLKVGPQGPTPKRQRRTS
jgi:hypothetical protein